MTDFGDGAVDDFDVEAPTFAFDTMKNRLPVGIHGGRAMLNAGGVEKAHFFEQTLRCWSASRLPMRSLISQIRRNLEDSLSDFLADVAVVVEDA